MPKRESVKVWAYFSPILFTLIFVVFQYTEWWSVPLFLILVIALLSNRLGNFTDPNILNYYNYFHENPSFQKVKTGMGIAFIIYNIWILVFLFYNTLSGAQWVGFMFVNIIINSGLVLSLAHDLMHSKRASGRATSRILLGLNGFFYLEVDHLMIHHHSVGTTYDPASATMGQSIYRYLPFSIKKRLSMVFFDDKIPPKLKSNMTGIIVISLIYLLLSALIGLQSFVVTIIQFIAVILIYETVTYIQHYGLRKRELSMGVYEKTTNKHSWNSFNIVNNFMYFFMPVHSFHHTGSGQAETADDLTGPIMPYPFPTMLLLPYLPTLWFKKIDPLVTQYADH